MGGRSRFAAGAGARWLRLALIGCGLVAFIWLTIAVTLSQTRTFQVEARTLGARIAFDGLTNVWELEEAVVCLPRKVPDRRAEAGAWCASPDMVRVRRGAEVIDWPDGAVVRLRLGRGGHLEIRAVSGTPAALPPGAVAVVPAARWEAHGALLVTGRMRIGEDMASGARGYLIAGAWEARQTGFISSLFRRTTEVVKSGVLSRGAVVEIIDEGRQDGPAPAQSYGHVTPVADDDGGMAITALSERGRMELQLSYFGLPDPVRMRPDWIDTTTNSPVLLALLGILTLVGAVLQLAGTLRRGG